MYNELGTHRGEACVEWTGYINRYGYGVVHLSNRTDTPRSVLVHRRAYELAVGPIPDGLTIDHLCRVKHCVNVDHMEPVTRAENTIRARGARMDHDPHTHCVNGHPFDDANTYLNPADKGRRSCRACVTAVQRRTRAKRKALRCPD